MVTFNCFWLIFSITSTTEFSGPKLDPFPNNPQVDFPKPVLGSERGVEHGLSSICPGVLGESGLCAPIFDVLCGCRAMKLNTLHGLLGPAEASFCVDTEYTGSSLLGRGRLPRSRRGASAA